MYILDSNLEKKASSFYTLKHDCLNNKTSITVSTDVQFSCRRQLSVWVHIPQCYCRSQDSQRWEGKVGVGHVSYLNLILRALVLVVNEASNLQHI